MPQNQKGQISPTLVGSDRPAKAAEMAGSKSRLVCLKRCMNVNTSRQVQWGNTKRMKKKLLKSDLGEGIFKMSRHAGKIVVLYAVATHLKLPGMVSCPVVPPTWETGLCLGVWGQTMSSNLGKPCLKKEKKGIQEGRTAAVFHCGTYFSEKTHSKVF